MLKRNSGIELGIRRRINVKVISKFLEKMVKRYPKTFKWWGRFPATTGGAVGTSISLLGAESNDPFIWWFHCYVVIVFSVEMIKYYFERRLDTKMNEIIVETELLKALYRVEE